MAYKDLEKQREFQRKWLKARKDVWLAANGPCVKCGSSEGLEVDHIDPAAKVDHKVWSWSAARREAELSKCQVLCGKCHREKTADDHLARVVHGSERMYRAHGCRCPACRSWKSEENAKRKVMGWQ